MRIIFSDKQNEAMDALASEKYNFILFGGAMGGGKTFFGLSSLLIMCQLFPKSRWCVIRENMEKIRITTIPSFQKLNASGVLKSSPYEYTHPNGSVIMFKGENYDNDKDLNWLKGLEVTGFLFEEINECQEMTLDIAFGRAGRWESDPRPKPIILATCNPSNGWVKKRIYDKFKSSILPPTWLYIPSKITDNPYLTEDYKANLLNMPTYQYEVFVNGNWDIQLKVGGECYKCFELDQHVHDVEYNANLPLHISWDDNVNPYLPLGIYQIEGKKIKCIDEIAGVTPLNTIKAVCAEFKRKYPAHTSGVFVYGDATAQKEDTKLEKGYNFYRLVTDELKEYRPQMRVLRSNPSVVMRLNWINTVLEKNIGGIEVQISKKCTHTINDLILTKEAPDGTKFKEMATDPKTKVRYQKVGHFSDCFIGETLIETDLGSKRIDKIQVGDNVLTRVGFRKVTKTYNHGIKNVTTYIIGNNKITCTNDHKIWTKEHGFKEIGQLIYKNTFCVFDKKINTWGNKLLLIKQRHVQENAQSVYDIQVENDHEFFANNILVHNCFDYIMVGAFGLEFSNYQKGNSIAPISYKSIVTSKNNY